MNNIFIGQLKVFKSKAPATKGPHIYYKKDPSSHGKNEAQIL